MNLSDLPTQTAASDADELELSKDQAGLDTDISSLHHTGAAELTQQPGTLSNEQLSMRRQLKIETPATEAENLTSGAAVSQPAKREGAGPDDDVSDLDRTAKTATEDLAAGHAAPAKPGEHDNYGHDRASMDGAEAHEVEVEHVTLESEQLAMEERLDAVDEAFDVVAALEELAELTKAGPLTKPAAKAMSIATEHLLGRVGIADSVVAMEDFDKSDAIDVESKEVKDAPAADPTAATGSKIMAKVKQIWQAIIQALIKAKRWIKDHLRRLFDDSASLLRRAEALEKTATTNVPSAEVIAQQVDLPRLVGMMRNLTLYGKFPSNIAKAAHDTAGLLTMQFNRLHSPSLLDGSFLQKISDPAFINNIKYEPHRQLEQSALTEHGKDIDEATGRASTGDFTVHSSVEMLGGYRIVQAVLDHSAMGEDALRAMVHTPELMKVRGSFDPNVGTSNLESSKVVAGAAKVICQSVANVRDLQTRLDKLSDEMIEACKKLEHSAEHSSTWQRYYLSKAPRMFVSEPAKLVSYGLRIARTLLNYAELMLKATSVPAGDHRAAKADDAEDNLHAHQAENTRRHDEDVKRKAEQMHAAGNAHFDEMMRQARSRQAS